MGKGKDRKQRFLQEHPYCCFCGGSERATEIDHIPSRQLFLNKVWPEGFEFPACVLCNFSTRHEEQKVAFLSRMYSYRETPTSGAELRRICRAIGNNYPDLLSEMRPSLDQHDRALGTITSATGTKLILPYAGVANARGSLTDRALSTFGRKLIFALHYKHAGSIIPSDGIIVLKWFTNEVLLSGGLRLAKLVHNAPPIHRGKLDLADQFNYEFAVDMENGASMFLAYFRLSFAIVGAAAPNPALLNVADRQIEIHRPFQHGGSS